MKKLIKYLIRLYNDIQAKLTSHPISHLPLSKVDIQPIIMIPGSSATENRFNKMVRMLNHGQHALLGIAAGKLYILGLR